MSSTSSESEEPSSREGRKMKSKKLKKHRKRFQSLTGEIFGPNQEPSRAERVRQKLLRTPSKLSSDVYSSKAVEVRERFDKERGKV